jgi:hypothetical protein
MPKELLSTNGHLSTTSTVQFIGSVAVIALTVYAVITEQPYAMTLLNDLLLYLFGATTAKGIVTSYQAKVKSEAANTVKNAVKNVLKGAKAQ